MKSGDAHAVKACVAEFLVPISVLAIINGGALARQSANSGPKAKVREAPQPVNSGCTSAMARLGS